MDENEKNNGLPASELAERIKALKPINSTENPTSREGRKSANAEPPITIRLRHRMSETSKLLQHVENNNINNSFPEKTNATETWRSRTTIRQVSFRERIDAERKNSSDARIPDWTRPSNSTNDKHSTNTSICDFLEYPDWNFSIWCSDQKKHQTRPTPASHYKT